MTSRIRHRGEHHDLTAPRTRRATGSMIITFRPRLLAFCHSTDLKMKYALTSGMRGGSRKHDTILRHAEFHRAKSVKSSIFRWNTLIRREYGWGGSIEQSPTILPSPRSFPHKGILRRKVFYPWCPGNCTQASLDNGDGTRGDWGRRQGTKAFRGRW